MKLFDHGEEAEEVSRLHLETSVFLTSADYSPEPSISRTASR